MVNGAAMALRRREPSLTRPFRVPLHPVPEIVAITINTALLIALIREETLYTSLGYMVLAAISLGYALTRRVAPARFEAALPPG
jgi:amino acid transporter